MAVGNLVERTEETLSSPEKERRNLLIGINGATGVGKTTLAELLKEKFEVKIFEEKFRQNPFLKKFYADPPRWSFLSQSFFIIEKIGQMALLPELLKTEPGMVDPTDWQDSEIYAFVQYQMGWMSTEEYQTYLLLRKTLTMAKEIPSPDLVISVHAPIEVIIQRIIERGREYELWMLENYPDYFPSIAKRTEEWAQENLHKVPIIIVDAHKNNYADDPFGIYRVMTQIQTEVYERMGDTKEVILPEVFQSGGLFKDPRAGNLSKIMR